MQTASFFEQWTPVKAGFPLPATEARKVFEALSGSRRLPCPARATRSTSSSNRALGCAIREVKVHRADPVTVGGCMAELCDDVANDRTVAVESEDAAEGSAVEELGLGGYTNTSYPRGLMALIDAKPRATR